MDNMTCEILLVLVLVLVLVLAAFPLYSKPFPLGITAASKQPGQYVMRSQQA